MQPRPDAPDRPREVPDDKRPHPGIRTKIYVRDDMIGGGKMELLRHVHETGSVAAAARIMAMDTARTRFLLDTLQACFADPLLDPRDGAGPARLTPLGRELLARFDAHQAAVAAVSRDFLAWLEGHQPAD